jgi:succinyl-diaminopimelate desuccinylase
MLATSDEECGSSGAEAVAASRALEGVRYGICGEPTSLHVLVGEKGMLWVRVVAEGKSAHGSRPEEGINAIGLCMEALKTLTKRHYPFEPDVLMGKPTINIGVINGGIKVNVVPNRCEALVDMRLVKGQEIHPILEQMGKRLEAAGLSERVRVEYVHGLPAVITPIDSEIVPAALEAIRKVTGRLQHPHAATFGTDCSVLQPKSGILNVICGPGSIEQAHQPDEYISIKELISSVEVYLQVARHFADGVS